MSILNLITCYEDAWKNIIMPPRQEYSVSSLGPTKFHVKNNRIHRQDFKLSNKRGQMIECSFYQQLDIIHACPCVVYLHTSGGSRIETLEIINLVLANPVCFFSFDFAACGKSEGEYSSVGWFEQEDLECIINYIQNTGKVSKICLWGRSMGATTALLYSAKHFKAECLILDSPFSDLKLLIQEVAKKNAPIPNFVAKVASLMIRKTVLNKADFDIEEIKPIEYITKIRVPALFGAAKEDTFVSPQHTQDLYSAYLGPKKIECFEGNHSSARPIQWFKAVLEFLKENLFDDKIMPQQVKHFTTSDFQSPRHLSEVSQTDVERPHTQQCFTPRQLKFSWLEPKSCQNTPTRSKLAQSKYLQNIETVSLSQQVQQSQNKKSPLAFDPTVFLPSKTGYKINNDISEPSIRADEVGAESFMKTSEMWQSQHEKSPLGPKLVSICPQPSKSRNSKKTFQPYRHQTRAETPNHKSATLTYKSSTPHPRQEYRPESPIGGNNNITYDVPPKFQRSVTGGPDFNYLHSSETSYLSNNTNLYTLPNDLTMRASTLDIQHTNHYRQTPERFDRYPAQVLPSDLTENLYDSKTQKSSFHLNQRKSHPNTPTVIQISDSSLNYGAMSKKVPLNPVSNYRASVNYSPHPGLISPKVYPQKHYESPQHLKRYGESHRTTPIGINMSTPDPLLDKTVSVRSILDGQYSQYAKGI